MKSTSICPTEVNIVEYVLNLVEWKESKLVYVKRVTKIAYNFGIDAVDHWTCKPCGCAEFLRHFSKLDTELETEVSPTFDILTDK